MKKTIGLMMLCILSGCSSVTNYENPAFPTGEWQPVNPEHFGKNEVQRLYEGGKTL